MCMAMSISRRGAFRLAFGLVSLVVSAAGLSAATVNIVGIPGGGTQSLPINYVQSFQRWVVQDRQVLSRVCNTAISEIEWSDDIQIRPTLDVLIKSGAPSYVMTGLQIRGSNKDLCPLARQWTIFSFAVEPTFRVETFISNNNNDEISHEALILNDNPVEQMKQAIELFGMVLSQIGEGSPLSEGFHIMSIPLKTDWSALPSPENGSYTLTCLATAEPEAEELLTIDPSLVEMTISSVLELRVVPAGVESDGDATCES